MSPIVRISIFVFVATGMLTNAIAQLEHLNSDEMPHWTWVGWFRFVGYIILAGFFAFGRWLPKPPEGNGTQTPPPEKPKE